MKPWFRKEPFVHLPDDAIQALGQVAEVCRRPRGAILFREGDPSEALWVLQRGWIALMKRTAEGKVLTIDLATPRDGIFGLSAFSGQPYLASAVANTPVEAVRLPATQARGLLRLHTQFAACVAEVFSHRFHHMASAYATAFAPVEQRIASVLLRLAEDFGEVLPVTRREIAELAGTTVETSIRVTRQMQRDGLVSMSRGRVTLVRPKAIAAKSRVVGARHLTEQRRVHDGGEQVASSTRHERDGTSARR